MIAAAVDHLEHPSNPVTARASDWNRSVQSRVDEAPFIAARARQNAYLREPLAGTYGMGTSARHKPPRALFACSGSLLRAAGVLIGLSFRRSVSSHETEA